MEEELIICRYCDGSGSGDGYRSCLVCRGSGVEWVPVEKEDEDEEES